MKQAAAGFGVHSGWAARVAVCVEKGAPRVVARERVYLVEKTETCPLMLPPGQ